MNITQKVKIFTRNSLPFWRGKEGLLSVVSAVGKAWKEESFWNSFNLNILEHKFVTCCTNQTPVQLESLTAACLNRANVWEKDKQQPGKSHTTWFYNNNLEDETNKKFHNEQIDFNKYVLTFGVFFVVSQQPSGPWQRNHLSCLSVLLDTSQP